MVLDGPNGGYGKAMNRGIGAARGEYVGIVEPDDYVALTMYEDLYQIASDHNLDLVKADFYRFRRDVEGDMSLVYYALDPTKQWYGQVIDASMEPEALRFVMNTWSGIYRRAFLEERGIFHHETPGASFQDNGFWVQTFVYAKRIMIVNHPYYFNRRDNPNSSVKDPKKIYCMNNEYNYIEDLLRPQEEIWDRFGPMLWFLRYGNYRFTMDRIDASALGEYLTRFQEDFLRARSLGELDESLFAGYQWEALTAIMKDPSLFSKKFALRRRLKDFARKRAVWLRQKLPKL